MLWLYLLALVTFLTIVVRRLLRRQNPLVDDLFAKRIAIEHVHDGVAWVTARGKIDYANPSLARMLEGSAEVLKGRSWLDIFANEDRGRVEMTYSQALLAGKASVDASVVDSHGGTTRRSVLVVVVHDHKTRLAGHHCIVENRALDAEPEERLAFAVRG